MYQYLVGWANCAEACTHLVSCTVCSTKHRHVQELQSKRVEFDLQLYSLLAESGWVSLAQTKNHTLFCRYFPRIQPSQHNHTAYTFELTVRLIWVAAGDIARRSAYNKKDQSIVRRDEGVYPPMLYTEVQVYSPGEALSHSAMKTYDHLLFVILKVRVSG